MKIIRFTRKQFQLELNGFLAKSKKNEREGKTWNEILKPFDKVAAPFIGMAVGAKTRNTQSTQTTRMSLKTKSSGRKSNLTDQRVTASVKSLCIFDSKIENKMSSSFKGFCEHVVLKDVLNVENFQNKVTFIKLQHLKIV